MSKPTTAQLVALLTAWRDGSALADTLVPDTDAMLARLREPAARKPAPCHIADTSTAGMTEAQVFAYYKRTALREDVRFFLAHAPGLSDVLATRAAFLLAELEHRKSTPADRKAYNLIADAWRRESLIADQRIAQIQATRLARGLARSRRYMPDSTIEEAA